MMRVREMRIGYDQNSSSDISEIREVFRGIKEYYVSDRHSIVYEFLKRCADILLSVLFITLIMSWLFPLIAILIKLSSRGPVLFVQRRTGKGGTEFDCYKFRTMYVNNEAHTKQATTNDKRITPIGRLLRISHLDEVPQFFNVLIGNMSIVGPRPHMLYHTRFFAQSIPYYHLRHEVRPGMTGMAQIKGYLGEINDERELRKRVQWDIYYLKNRSFTLDMKIIFTTFWQIVQKTVTQLFK